MKIVYCDDDFASCKLFKKLSDKYSSEHNVLLDIDIFNDSQKICESVIKMKEKYDIYFLDILMPGQTGIQIAKGIREYDKDGIIIFITSSDDFHKEAYELEVIQYLYKPLKYIDVERSYDRASRLIETYRNKTITVRIPNGLKNVETSEIVCVESYLHVLKFHMSNNTSFDTANSSITLSELNKLLTSTNFNMVSRSYIINLDYVESIDGDNLAIRNYNTLIKIPIKQLAKFKGKYLEYIKSTK